MLTRNLFRRPRIALEDAGVSDLQQPESPGALYSACPKCRAIPHRRAQAHRADRRCGQLHGNVGRHEGRRSH